MLNPTWTVPPSILEQDILPEARKTAKAITRRHLKVFDRSGRELNPAKVPWRKLSADNFPYVLRQDPGPRNALGRVKLMFPTRTPSTCTIHRLRMASWFASSPCSRGKSRSPQHASKSPFAAHARDTSIVMKLAALAYLSALVLPSLASLAQAQEPAASALVQPAPAESAPAASVVLAPQPIDDVLILLDGSVARGTLLERNASGDVVFLTALGETRRVPASAVRYVGPASAPAASQAALPAETPSAPVALELVAVGPPVTFHARGPSPQRDTHIMCTAPCKSQLPAGSYQLSLTLADGDPLTVKQPLTLDRNGVLYGSYKSRDMARRAGLGVFAISGIVGASLTLLAARCLPDEGGYCKREDGYRATGITILSTGLLTGLVLMFLPDKAQVSWLAKN